MKKLVSPLGDFGYVEVPLDPILRYEISDEELSKLKDHSLKWKIIGDVVVLAANDNAAEKQREKRLNDIALLKDKLAATDYKAIKYAEGAISEAEYAFTKAQRQEWRDEINTLEGTLK